MPATTVRKQNGKHSSIPPTKQTAVPLGFLTKLSDHLFDLQEPLLKARGAVGTVVSMGSSEHGDAPDPKTLLWLTILLDELLERVEDGIQEALEAIEEPKRADRLLNRYGASIYGANIGKQKGA
jgi:hypothetical protein